MDSYLHQKLLSSLPNIPPKNHIFWDTCTNYQNDGTKNITSLAKITKIQQNPCWYFVTSFRLTRPPADFNKATQLEQKVWKDQTQPPYRELLTAQCFCPAIFYIHTQLVTLLFLSRYNCNLQKKRCLSSSYTFILNLLLQDTALWEFAICNFLKAWSLKFEWLCMWLPSFILLLLGGRKHSLEHDVVGFMRGKNVHWCWRDKRRETIREQCTSRNHTQINYVPWVSTGLDFIAYLISSGSIPAVSSSADTFPVEFRVVFPLQTHWKHVFICLYFEKKTYFRYIFTIVTGSVSWTINVICQ